MHRLDLSGQRFAAGDAGVRLWLGMRVGLSVWMFAYLCTDRDAVTCSSKNMHIHLHLLAFVSACRVGGYSTFTHKCLAKA